MAAAEKDKTKEEKEAEMSTSFKLIDPPRL